MLEATDIKYIVRDEKVFGGKPTIEGHRIAVHDVAVLLWQGLSAEQIAAEYSLKPAQVYAALAYYYDHKAQIDCEIKDEDGDIRRLAAADQDPLAQRMRAAVAERKRTKQAGA